VNSSGVRTSKICGFCVVFIFSAKPVASIIFMFLKLVRYMIRKRIIE
jgi:hypothetical protein